MAMIDRNFTFATNGTVTANDLHNLIDSATIYQDLITGQQPITSVGTNYELLIADGTNPNAAPNAVTVYDLFEDALSVGTYTGLNLTGALTYGTATGTRLVSANATITTGTITTGVIPTLTSSTATFGTTTSTAATITSGTVTNLASTTGTIATLNSTTGTIATLNSTTGTIGNLSTTLAGDFTISQGTGTLGTSGVTLGTYGGATSIPVLAIDAKGRVTTASTSAITSGLTGFRNRIINGDMRIWQRGTSGFTTTNSKTFVADRMCMFSGSSTTSTASQVTGTTLSGFPFATRIQRVSGNTGTSDLVYLQAIETANCQDLAGSTVSVSFYARAGSNYSAASNNLLALVATGSGSDQGTDSWISGTWTNTLTATVGTAVLTTSWQRFSYSYTVPAGTNEIILAFNSPRVGTAGANDYFDITGVQLEAGSTATEFERRPIGMELSLCQRYFDSLVTPAANGVAINGSTASRIGTRTSVTMRSSPSVSISGTISINDGSGTFNVTSASIAGSFSSVNSFQLDINGLSTAQYRPFIILVGSGTGAIVLNSEL